MTFKQLLQNNSWASISCIFLEIYPDAEENIDRFKTVFEKLALMAPEEMDMSIDIATEQDDPDEEAYIEVLGVYNKPKNEEEHYSQAIEFTPWCQWLGMDISEESLADFSEQEIIVHCLYEMTFVGFSEEEIQKALGRSEKNKEERKSLPEDERYATEASIEELFKEIDELDEDDGKD